MYQTNYHRAQSTEDAARLMAGVAEGKYLSGGQTLLPTMKQRLAAPSDLIDLSRIAAMQGISIDGRKVTIGAATTHAAVAASRELAAICPGITALAGMIGDPAVRHRGTLDAAEFFTGMFETALEDGEIVTAVSFEAPEKSAYEKFRNPASRYAMAGVFVAKTGGQVRVAVTGAGSGGVFRHAGMEAALAASWNPSAIDGTSVDESAMLSDIHGSAAYRAALVKAMAKRAVAKA